MENLEQEIKKLDLKQNAIKILINAFYGAFGNKYFYFHNTDIAQSITLQGQDMIKFTITAVNHYFRNKWHLDTELHKILGIDGYEIRQINEDCAIYTDTDSIYVYFYPTIKSVIGLPPMTDDEKLKFCIAINDNRLTQYFQQVFKKYGNHFNTNNRQDFKLENLSKYGIWLKKKNYILKVVAEGNQALGKNKEYLIIKGLENVKSSWPIWARTHLSKLDEMILEKGPDLNIEKELIPVLRELREEMEGLEIDQISQNFNLNEYDKYVVSDYPLVLEKGTPINSRASSYHNYLLKHNRSQKYNPIRAGSKVKMYHVDSTINSLPEIDSEKYPLDVFAYSPGAFPKEFAPPIDKRKQFFILIVEPINRLLTAMKMTPLDEDLKRDIKLQHTKSKKVRPAEDWYPVTVVNSETYETCEMPEHLSQILVESSLNSKPIDVPEQYFSEYLSYVSMYGLNTVLVPRFDLEKQIKKMKDKKARALAKEQEETETDE